MQDQEGLNMDTSTRIRWGGGPPTESSAVTPPRRQDSLSTR